MSNTIKYAETVKFHKKKAELQVKLSKPEADEAGKIVKSGAVFFEIANALPGTEADPKMDWQNKIIMKIGVNDIGVLLDTYHSGLEESKLFHQTEQGNSTSLTMKKGENGSYLIGISKKIADKQLKAGLYLSAPDMEIFSIMLKSALPTILGWS